MQFSETTFLRKSAINKYKNHKKKGMKFKNDVSILLLSHVYAKCINYVLKAGGKDRNVDVELISLSKNI